MILNLLNPVFVRRRVLPYENMFHCVRGVPVERPYSKCLIIVITTQSHSKVTVPAVLSAPLNNNWNLRSLL